MLEQSIVVYSDKKGVPPLVHMVQGDSGRVLICVSNDYAYDGTEVVSLMCMRPDGTMFSYLGEVDTVVNAAVFALDVDGGALTQEGNVAAQVIVSKEDEFVTSFKLNIVVDEALGGEATTEDITFLNGLQAQLDAWIATAQADINRWIAGAQTQLNGKVDKTTTVNGHALSSNISLTPSDVGALPSSGGTVNGNILLNSGSTKYGYYLKDGGGTNYAAAYDSGASLWFGSAGASGPHHNGNTYISSGYNGTAGNDSVYVSVPNEDNDGASNYKVYHEGYKPSAADVGIGIATKTFSNISTNQYHEALLGTLTSIGVPDGATVLGLYAKGFTSITGDFNLALNSAGDSVYLIATAGKTFGSITVVVAYAS